LRLFMTFPLPLFSMWIMKLGIILSSLSSILDSTFVIATGAPCPLG